jgi:arabinofuranosyltransferase
MQWTDSLRRLIPVIVIFLTHAWLYSDFFIDDAYISLRYVNQWQAGNGLVYNMGERVEGYSNFLWIALLGLLGRTGMDLVFAARLWGIGFSIATLVLVYLFVRRLPFPLFSPLFLALSAPFAMWAVGGLENPLFMFLAFAGSWLFYREEVRSNGWTSSIFWGLLALTRPDGMLFSGVAFLYRVARLYRLRQWPQLHDYLRALVLAAIVLPHFIWRLIYYGYPLPNTIYAKSMGLNLRTLLEGGYYIYSSFEIIGGFFFVSLLAILVLATRQRYSYAPYFTLNVATYFLFIFAVGGDWMPAQRFLASVLPQLVVIVHAGAAELVRLLSPVLPKPLAWTPILLQLIYIGAISLNARFIAPGIPVDHRLSLPYPWVIYLKEQIHETDTIAVLDAGFVSYSLPLTVRIVDLVGLTDEHIAHRPPQFPGGLWGRGDAWGRWDVDYVLAQNPRFVQMHLHGMDEEGKWRTGFTGTTQLVNDPRFQERYRQSDFVGLFELARDEIECNSASDAKQFRASVQ